MKQNTCNHTHNQLRYTEWHEWATLKTKQGHKQTKCGKCLKWLFKCER